MDKHIQAPITKEVSESLRAGLYLYSLEPSIRQETRRTKDG